MRRDLTIHQWKILRRLVREKNKPVLGKELKNLVLSRKMKKGDLLQEMVSMGLLVRSKDPVAGVKLTSTEEGATSLVHTYTATPLALAAAETGDYQYDVVREKGTDRIVGYKIVPDQAAA